MIRFIEETHTYLDEKGRRVPSVTQILSIVSAHTYGDINESVLENARQRGNVVHFAVRLYEEANMESIKEEYKGYLDAYKKAKEKYNIEVDEMEKLVYNSEHNYAGTLDILGKVDGEDAIIDIKTTSVMHKELVTLQTNAYANCDELRGKGYKLYVLQLKDDGTYKLIKLERKFGVFKAMIDIAKYFKGVFV